MATLALETCTLHPRLDQNLLLTAAIVHDLGKTREFTLGAEIGLTDEGRLLGPRRARAAHARRARRRRSTSPGGSPSRTACSPTTATGARRRPEALALQRLNAIDAAVKGALEHGMPTGP